MALLIFNPLTVIKVFNGARGYIQNVFCRHRGERVLSAPWGGAVGLVEAPAPVHPGGGEDLQDFHQDNSGRSPDDHLLRRGAEPGAPERRLLQVLTAPWPTYTGCARIASSNGAVPLKRPHLFFFLPYQTFAQVQHST